MAEDHGKKLPGAAPSRPDAGGRLPLLKLAEWSPQLEIGLPLIDEQHKRFFDLAASLNGNGDEIRVMKTLAILSDYIRSHFRDEEILMRAGNYPDLAAHCRLHEQFRHMLADLLGRARQMSLDDIAEEVRYLINGWFYQHIVSVDADYAPYVVPDKSADRRKVLRQP